MPKIIYSNCLMLAPDGTKMCRIDEKRARRYVELNRAIIEEENPLVIRLTFQPKAFGNLNDPLSLEPIDNICVVCGATENLSRHHCVPQCLRKYLPEQFKSSYSHDIVLLCLDCHREYEIFAAKKKEAMLKGCEEPMQQNEDLDKALAAANTLVKYSKVIPAERQEELFCRIENFTKQAVFFHDLMEILNREQKRGSSWELFSKKINDVQEIVVDWRSHFVKTMNPKFLPRRWNINHVKAS